MALRHLAITSLAAALSLSWSHAARAIDPFEIQVYDGTANDPGVPGLELHVNRVFAGRTDSAPPELAQNHQTHFTLEPSLGLFHWWELGGYFQTALRGDGTFDYAGLKLRSKFVTTRGFSEHTRLGINLELSVLPSTYDAGRIGSEIRPIVAWENDRFLFALNPIVDLSYEGRAYRDGPTFEPAAMAKVKLFGLALGLESYSSLGPIAKPDGSSSQVHYLFEAVDLLAIPHFECNVGIGQGLTSASNSFVAKVILGYSWEPDERPPSAARLPSTRASPPLSQRTRW